MPGNHLEQLVAEWYQLQGFFVRRNVKVGPLKHGGHECELDIVAFHPVKKLLVHVEPSADAHTWAVREGRFAKKFKAGRRHIPSLFEGLKLPKKPDQIALLLFGGGTTKATIGGGRVMFVIAFMREILDGIRGRKVTSSAIPEEFSLLRTLQFAARYWPILT